MNKNSYLEELSFMPDLGVVYKICSLIRFEIFYDYVKHFF